MKATGNQRVHWWQWPTVLSLDAPAVALVWQALLAQGADVRFGWPEPAVLGAAVWLAYAADRWIEGWRLAPDQVQTQRHAFYQRFRWPIAILWLSVFGAAVEVAFTRLSPRELGGGGILLAAVLAYLLSHQLIHRRHRWRAPKEVCVAVLLAAGCALFIVTRTPAGLGALAVPLTLFALLCFANCALISVWEHEVDARHGQTSLALQFSHGAEVGRVVPLVVMCVAAGAYLFQPSAHAAAGCAWASAAALYGVDLLEPRMGRRGARVLADLVLLTPVIPLLVRLLR